MNHKLDNKSTEFALSTESPFGDHPIKIAIPATSRFNSNKVHPIYELSSKIELIDFVRDQKNLSF